MAASKTTDNGTSWTRYNLGTLTGMAYALVLEPGNSNVVYVGGKENNVATIYKTTNAGNNWTKLTTPGLPDSVVYALAIDPYYPNEIYVGTNRSCYKSTNGGNTWFTTNFTGGRVNAIVVNRGSSAYDGVYVGTHTNGVYLSTDWGTSWTQINQGLQNLQINCLGKSQSMYIYAGTQTKGIYRWSIQVGNEETGNDIISQENRLIIKPNPTTGILKITYQLDKPGKVSMGIYDIQGRLIKLLENRDRPAGTYSLIWNCTDLNTEIPAGIYFCRLQTEDYKMWKRFILVR
ncbi:MAG: T9SS type A sorting domain-containing protein [candidate division WOR-3 bacterium]